MDMDMDWIEKIKKIRSKLLQNGYTYEEKEILDAQLVMGTPGEMFLSVISKLREFKKNKPEVYNIIVHETEDLITFGKSINYLN